MWRHGLSGAKEDRDQTLGTGLKLSWQGLTEEALGGFGAVAWVSPGRILSRKISHHKALFEQL